MKDRISRRGVLKGTAATALAMSGLGTRAHAQTYPSQALSVVIGSAQGGGLERIARAFSGTYETLLGQPMEFDFNPGAGGQLAYELFVHRTKADAYNLLFGNLSAEAMMYSLQSPNYKVPEDVWYYAGLDLSEETVIWVRKDSEFQNIEQLVEAGKSRTITVGNSRLSHPSSLGALAFADAVGIDINLVPFGGGGPTIRSTLAGEVDAAATPIGLANPLGDDARILTIFSRDNILLASSTQDAPYVNDVFGTDLPSFPTMTAWAVHTSVKEEFPDRLQTLMAAAEATVRETSFLEAYERTGMGVREAASFVDHDAIMKHFNDMTALTDRFRDVIAG